MLRHVLTPLAIGIAIYILWRPTSLLAFHWIEMIGLLQPTLHVRAMLSPVQPLIPSWILYSLPDGLWAYSFTSAIAICWDRRLTTETLAWCSIPFVLGVGSELGQLALVVPGVFEVADLACYSTDFLLALYLTGESNESFPNCLA